MFGVEEEEKTKESAIIMELCSGGSLYNVLEEPEFIYGLKELDLRKLIQDVTSGMSYLREKVTPLNTPFGFNPRLNSGNYSSRYQTGKYSVIRQVKERLLETDGFRSGPAIATRRAISGYNCLSEVFRLVF